MTTYVPTVGANALASRSTNGFAIAAFVLSLLGWFVLSIPFGFVALHQIKDREEDGRGLAIASLWISALEICLCIAAVGLGIAFLVSHPAPPAVH
jgi:hypothetical protein